MNRPCWICKALGICEHREPELWIDNREQLIAAAMLEQTRRRTEIQKARNGMTAYDWDVLARAMQYRCRPVGKSVGNEENGNASK